MFNILSARVDLGGTRVLDLFAGSGALGLEALSRGAAAAVFVEQERKIADVIRGNGKRLGVEASIRVVVADAIRFLSEFEGPKFDVALADPPYSLADTDVLPDLALGVVSHGGLLILEHASGHGFGGHPNLVLQRSYGRTCISLFSPQ